MFYSYKVSTALKLALLLLPNLAMGENYWENSQIVLNRNPNICVAAQGAKVKAKYCDQTDDSQLWIHGKDQILKNKATGTCMMVNEQNHKLQLADCNSGLWSQRWVQHGDVQRSIIENVWHKGHCLDAYTNEHYGHMTMYKCGENNSNQIFSIKAKQNSPITLLQRTVAEKDKTVAELQKKLLLKTVRLLFDDSLN